MRIGVFGCGAPLGVFASIGLAPVDVTLRQAGTGTAADRYIEPFMDPFAASVLRGMAAGDFDDLDAIIFLRESPGAMIACQYAFELARRGVLPKAAPQPIMLNILPADHAAAERFNRAELDRLTDTLATLGWTPEAGMVSPAETFERLISMQSAGILSGAAAFEKRRALAETGMADLAGQAARLDGPRIALLGAPLGNAALHAALDATGILALDQQALDQAHVARGRTLADALAAQAGNPFAARQPEPVYVDAVRAALKAHRIDRVAWQVEPHDDLWGWLAPQVRALCMELGIGFTDLGFVPRWPMPADIDALPLAEAVA